MKLRNLNNSQPISMARFALAISIFIVFFLLFLQADTNASLELDYRWDGNTTRIVCFENGAIKPEWLQEYALNNEAPLKTFIDSSEKVSSYEYVVYPEIGCSTVEGVLEVKSISLIINGLRLYRGNDCLAGEDTDGIFSIDTEHNRLRLNDETNILFSKYLRLAGILFFSIRIVIIVGAILFVILTLCQEKKPKMMHSAYSKLVSFNGRNDLLLGFIFALVLIGLYMYSIRSNGFRGDAYEMWEVAKTYLSDGEKYRSFVEYRSKYSFYILSIIYNASRMIRVNDIYFFRAVSSLIFATTFSVILPLIARYIGKWGNVNTIILVLVGFYFFRGYYVAPFTDPLGLFFLFCSLFLTTKVIVGIKEKKHYIKNILFSILSVGTLFISSCFRSSYRLTIYLYCAYVMLLVIRKKEYKKTIYLIPFLLFAVAGNRFFSGDTGVMAQQLVGQYEYQKVEFTGYATLLFENPLGSTLFGNGLDRQWWNDEANISDYIRVATNNIPYSIAMGIKGLFNGLDISTNSIITITQFEKMPYAFLLLNWSLIYLVFLFAVHKVKNLSDKEIIDSVKHNEGGLLNNDADSYSFGRFCLVVCLFNSLPYAFGMVEVRFFVSILSYLYMLAIQVMSSRKAIINNKFKAMVVYFIFIMTMLSVHMQTMDLVIG